MEGRFMKSPRILVIDDESSLRTALFRALDRKGYQVLTANRIQEAKMLVHGSQPLDLAIIDLNLPDGDGIEYMVELKSQFSNCEFLILTGQGSIETAIRAMQNGAFHFLTKPFNLDELLSLVERAIDLKKHQQEAGHYKKNQNKAYKFDQIVGQSEPIKDVLGIIERVAETDSTILVTGESGTGKELIARAIHTNSHRSSGPFVAINCGAIPSELLESELFGHMKGAFTGAISNRLGRFEMADGGTIFLDEIGDLPPNLQVKILRALQERRFEPVGGTKSVSVNVRVIAATNMDLEAAVEKGNFREDLFYRLNVIPIHVPALRDRPTDIPLLLKHFIDHTSKNRNRGLSGISPAALESLVNYPWPGNIRELENLVERMSVLKGSGILEVSDLPLKYKNHQPRPQDMVFSDLPLDGLDFNSTVDAFENALILKALEKTGWNRNQAALLLRLNRTTLVEKIKKKGLRPQNGESAGDSNLDNLM
jgi:DNA-binding NtrC family response regulator